MQSQAKYNHKQTTQTTNINFISTFTFVCQSGPNKITIMMFVVDEQFVRDPYHPPRGIVVLQSFLKL